MDCYLGYWWTGTIGFIMNGKTKYWLPCTQQSAIWNSIIDICNFYDMLSASNIDPKHPKCTVMG